jgi:hypothetical protein
MKISKKELKENISKMERGTPVLRNDGAFLVVVDLAGGEQTTNFFTLQELESHLTQRAGDLAKESAKRALSAVQSIVKELGIGNKPPSA